MGYSVGAIIVKIMADARGLDAGLSASEKRIGSFSKTAGRTGSAMTKGLTIPILAAAGASAHLALDFDHQMKLIGGLVGASQKQLDSYKTHILAMAPALGKTPIELAKALYFVTSSGFKGAAALRVLEASAKASAAGLGDTATVADAVTSAVNAYGEKSLSAAKATDVLLAAVREGKSEPEEFAGSIGRVIPVAAAMGVSFGEVAGTMAALSLNGTDANEAVTQITASLAQAIKPTKQGADALKDIGMDYAGLRKVIADQGLIEAFDMLKEKFGGNVEAIGKVFGNIRALRAVMTLTGPSAEKYAGIIGRVAQASGDTNAAFNKMAQSDSFKLQQAWAELQKVGIEMGDVVVPMLLDVVNAGMKLVTWFDELDPAAQKTVVTIGLFVAAVGPGLVLVGKMGAGVAVLMKAYRVLAGATTAAAVAQTALNAAQKTGGSGVPNPAAGLLSKRAASRYGQSQLAALTAGGAGAAAPGAAPVAAVALSAGSIAAIGAVIGGVVTGAAIGAAIMHERQTNRTFDRQMEWGGSGTRASRTRERSQNRAAMPGTQRAMIQDIILNLKMKGSSVAAGKPFAALLKQIDLMKKVAASGIDLRINEAKTADDFRSLKARLMGELHLTSRQADMVLTATFGKKYKLVKPDISQLGKATGQAQTRVQTLRALLAKRIAMGKTDNSALIAQIAAVTAQLNAMRIAGQNAAVAAANAVHGTGGAGGHAVSAAGRMVTSPLLTWVGEGGRPEVILPLTNKPRMLELMNQAGMMAPGFWGSAPSSPTASGGGSVASASSARGGGGGSVGDTYILYSPIFAESADVAIAKMARRGSVKIQRGKNRTFGVTQ